MEFWAKVEVVRSWLVAVACSVLVSACGASRTSQTAADRPLDDQLVNTATMLVVRDLARSLAFYRDSLGFRVQMNRRTIALLERDGMLLYLVTESPPTRDKPGVTLAPPPEPERTPVNLVFRVRDARRAHADLERRGVLFLAPPTAPPWGGLRCFTRDPDGYLIEIEQPPP